MDIDAIRHGLLNADDDWMRARRKIAAIAGLLAAEFGVLGMRQYGVIRHLPDLPFRVFDSNAVTTSRPAYPLGIPDASLGVVGAGALIVLATAGGTRRSGRSPWLDLALGAGVFAAGTGALVYLGEMIKLRRICLYCIAGSTGFLSLGPLAARGVLRAWRTIRGRS